MGKVAAIQMTSSHIVADNLAAAAVLLREAKEAGADVACLPENFCFIGLKDADKLQIAEEDGRGPTILNRLPARESPWSDRCVSGFLPQSKKAPGVGG